MLNERTSDAQSHPLWIYRPDSRVFDLDGRFPVRATYLITGTDLEALDGLAIALWDTFRAGMPTGYFRGETVARLAARWRVADRRGVSPITAIPGALARPARRAAAPPSRPEAVRRYTAALLHHRTGPDGIFGTTLSWDEVRSSEHLRERPASLLHQPLAIHITGTGGVDRSTWDAWYERHGLEPLRLDRRDLAANRERSLGAVLGHLQIEPTPLPPPRRPARLGRAHA